MAHELTYRTEARPREDDATFDASRGIIYGVLISLVVFWLPAIGAYFLIRGAGF